MPTIIFCLPSLLQRQGYSTEMVIGQHRDLNRLQTFFSRNGLQQLLDEGDFPSQAERAGLGIVDGALFDLCYERIKQRQKEGKPFFLTSLTLSTHHPFAAPPHHQEVRTLQKQVQTSMSGLSGIRTLNWSVYSRSWFVRGCYAIRSS